MILFHAPGGGLGHALRVLAVLAASPELARRAHVLLSTRWAGVLAPLFPAPVTRIPAETFAGLGDYHAFLASFLEQGRFRGLVLDAFPFGLFGEWRQVACALPRVLLARDLQWPVYCARIGGVPDVFPGRALAVEPLAPGYLAFLRATGEPSFSPGPVTPDPDLFPRPVWRPRSRWLVVHGGDQGERETLVALARREGGGEPDRLFPEAGIVPAEALFVHYDYVVSGAGYHATAAASRAPAGRRHLLHPFARALDDQEARRKRFLEGRQWSGTGLSGTGSAAAWIAARLL